MNWNLEIAFYWPHDRFALGWEYINSNEEYNFSTFRMYLFFITFTINFNTK